MSLFDANGVGNHSKGEGCTVIDGEPRPPSDATREPLDFSRQGRACSDNRSRSFSPTPLGRV
jgi:hypothetical protein